MHDDGSGINRRNTQSEFMDLEFRPNVTISGATGNVITVPQFGTVIEGSTVIPNVLQTDLEYNIDSQYCLTEEMGCKIDLTKSDEIGRTITYYKDTIDRGRVERVYKRNRNETHKYLVSSVNTSSEFSPIDMVAIIRLMIVHEKCCQLG